MAAPQVREFNRPAVGGQCNVWFSLGGVAHQKESSYFPAVTQQEKELLLIFFLPG